MNQLLSHAPWRTCAELGRCGCFNSGLDFVARLCFARLGSRTAMKMFIIQTFWSGLLARRNDRRGGNELFHDRGDETRCLLRNIVRCSGVRQANLHAHIFLAGCGERTGLRICKEHAQIHREANSGGCGEPTTPRQRRPDVYSRSSRLNLPGACSLMDTRTPFCARGIVGVLSPSRFRRIGF